jgi:hypothetical protein
VDIDHDTSEAARFLLETVGCAYIETSPSGDGLHGWALSSDPLPRCKGTLNGLHVEVYNCGRYFTVTGRALVQGPLVRSDRILRLSNALQRTTSLPAQLRVLRPNFTESTESTESTEDHKEQGVEREFLPTKVGERNAKLFDWCRHMKTLDPAASTQQQVRYAMQWFNAARAVIGTKDQAVTIDDFLRGWRVAIPETFALAAVRAAAATVPVPTAIAEALGANAMAYQVCIALQRSTEDRPFFLPTRVLARELGTSHQTAAAALRILRAIGVLILSAEHTRTKSPRYYVAPEYTGEGDAS